MRDMVREKDSQAIRTVSGPSKGSLVNTSGFTERLMITSSGLYVDHSEMGRIRGIRWLSGTGIQWKTPPSHLIGSFLIAGIGNMS